MKCSREGLFVFSSQRGMSAARDSGSCQHVQKASRERASEQRHSNSHDSANTRRKHNHKHNHNHITITISHGDKHRIRHHHGAIPSSSPARALAPQLTLSQGSISVELYVDHAPKVRPQSPPSPSSPLTKTHNIPPPNRPAATLKASSSAATTTAAPCVPPPPPLHIHLPPSGARAMLTDLPTS